MLLVTGALSEELNVATALCKRPARVDCAGVRLLRAVAASGTVCLLKTGVGPERAASRLELVLAQLQPEEILTVGYAGALDPGLRIGDLIIAQRASLLGTPDNGMRTLDELVLSGSWSLSPVARLEAAAAQAGLTPRSGAILTSRHIIGDPAQKQLLYRKFGATVVDMETGALARTAAARGVPYGCVRAISDEAADEFLAPVSYDPSSGPLSRVVKAALAGNWLRGYRQWRERAEAARNTLRMFLEHYLRRAQ
jgi:adenosylhomocysteine nucleosidase